MTTDDDGLIVDEAGDPAEIDFDISPDARCGECGRGLIELALAGEGTYFIIGYRRNQTVCSICFWAD